MPEPRGAFGRGGVFSTGTFIRTSRTDADVFEVISVDWTEERRVLVCISCEASNVCASCCASRSRFSALAFLSGIVLAGLNAVYLARFMPSMQQ